MITELYSRSPPFQTMNGFMREAELARAAHILGLQAVAQKRASMKLLRDTVARTMPAEVPGILGALINGCLPQPNAVSKDLTSSVGTALLAPCRLAVTHLLQDVEANPSPFDFRTIDPDRFGQYMREWSQIRKEEAEGRAVSRESAALRKQCLGALRDSYATIRAARERMFAAGKIPEDQRLPVSGEL